MHAVWHLQYLYQFMPMYGVLSAYLFSETSIGFPLTLRYRFLCRTLYYQDCIFLNGKTNLSFLIKSEMHSQSICLWSGLLVDFTNLRFPFFKMCFNQPHTERFMTFAQGVVVRGLILYRESGQHTQIYQLSWVTITQILKPLRGCHNKVKGPSVSIQHQSMLVQWTFQKTASLPYC